jgi:hypothetical protein
MGHNTLGLNQSITGAGLLQIHFSEIDYLPSSVVSDPVRPSFVGLINLLIRKYSTITTLNAQETSYILLEIHTLRALYF